MRLVDFGFRPRERFLYGYDFGDGWQHVVRVERILPGAPGRLLPARIGGARACPPEDCGGPWVYLELRQRYHPVVVARRLAEILGGVLDAADPDEAVEDAREEMTALVRWAVADCFARRQVNRRLRQYAAGDDAWRWPG